jgi:membrane fusion protein, multidrug efflux system
MASLGALAGCASDRAPMAPPPLAVAVTAVAEQDVPVHQEWVGTLSGFIDAEIRPQVKGYLRVKRYTEGDIVQAGDVLFEIDPREYQAELDQARGRLGQARAALTKSELDVARYRPLVAMGAVSRREFDDAVQARDGALAGVTSAQAAVEQAALNLGWTRVVSPIAGIAGLADAQIGDLVEPATKLTTISQLDPIKAVFPVSEQEYLRYARSHTSPDGVRRDDLELITADGTVFPRRGRLSVIGRAIGERTGTLMVEALFPNPGNILRPGGYAQVRATVDVWPRAKLIPQSAVVELQGVSRVAVVDADNRVEFRTVTLGPTLGPEVVVAAGVGVADRIVTDGLQKIRSGSRVVPCLSAGAPASAGADT